jgi:poly(hydroxyalkanoate) granule-associated protein
MLATHPIGDPGGNMATRKRTTSTSDDADLRDQTEKLTSTLSESAQQIWLAGLGAFGRAQAEGTKLFEALVREGTSFEKSAREFAGGQAEAVRGAVESGAVQARAHATETWDRIEKVFEARVQRALANMGVPARKELDELRQRVETMSAELRRQGRAPARRKAPATKSAVKKAAVTKAAPKKAAAKRTVKARKPAARPTAKQASQAARTPSRRKAPRSA